MLKLSRFVFGAALASAAIIPAHAAPRLSPEARLDRLLDGRTAGKPVDCINLRDIQSSEIIDRTAIVYRVGARYYVNRPRSGADWLDSDDILVTRTVTGQLCSIDNVNLIDRGSRFQRGFVSLGEFVPYSRR